MWFTKQSDGFRCWFAVKNSAGSLRSDLPSSSFVATVINPLDTSGSTFPVTQSSKQGLYRFDVPSYFLMSGGFGEYAALVEVNALAPNFKDAFTNVLRVTQDDFDSLSASIARAVWNATSSFYNASGSMGSLMHSASIQVAISASVSVDNAAIADAVWDEAVSGHLTSGSAGWVLNRIDEISLELSSTLTMVSGTVSQLYDMNFGRWKIDETTNQMIFYKEDNTTEIARFDLTDRVGSPTFESPFERTRV
jgi:hypothetical protein